MPFDKLLKCTRYLVTIRYAKSHDHRRAETLQWKVVYRRNVVDGIVAYQIQWTIIVPIRFIQMCSVLKQCVDYLQVKNMHGKKWPESYRSKRCSEDDTYISIVVVRHSSYQKRC